jgi:predicted acyl esterase
VKRSFVVGLIAIFALLGGPQAASAEISAVFSDNPYLDHGAPGGVECEVQGPGDNEGQRWCGTGQHNANNGNRSTVETFDGVPIDVNVAFPPAPESGPDGPWPLMMVFHGYGGGKINFPSLQRWIDRGFAVFSMSNRGFHESCGTTSSRSADPDCPTEGFVRLNDTRAEVRDAQEFAGMLVDQGVVDGGAIGAIGGSYGGGMSMALAALKDRTMLPDGSLVPWESPTDGTPLEIAVALPNIPWTDLAYSLAPNGSNIDYIRDASYFGRFGVMKQSYVSGLYVSGQTAPGYYLPAGQNLSGNITGWFNLLNLGEPYQGQAEAQSLLDEITTYHSSYYIDHSVAPAPLLISSGFTDDLFPANEATRYYNRTKSQYPNHEIGLFLGSFGHPRGQNKTAEVTALTTLENEWAEYYLLGTGERPGSEVTAYAQSCEAEPGTSTTAETWGGIATGEVRLRAAGAQTVSPTGGDRAVAQSFDPIGGAGACASPAGETETGVASYDLPPATDGGYTVMGSPTVIARIAQSGINSQIAARLVDVSPDGTTKTLVNRALWRPAPTTDHQVFQLQPNGWEVEEGHSLRLELLPGDYSGSPLANFGRPSNDQQPATISDLELRVPVLDQPGSAGGAVKAPAKRVLPARPGVRLAPGFGSAGSVRVAGGPKVVGRAVAAGNRLRVKVACRSAYRCPGKTRLVGAPKKGRKGKGMTVATVATGSLALGASKQVRTGISGPARKYFRTSRTLRVKLVWRGRTEGYAVIRRR